MAAVKPWVIVCLGVTTAQALLGRDFRLTQKRGQLIPSPFLMDAVYPSSILRAPDDATRKAEDALRLRLEGRSRAAVARLEV